VSIRIYLCGTNDLDASIEHAPEQHAALVGQNNHSGPRPWSREGHCPALPQLPCCCLSVCMLPLQQRPANSTQCEWRLGLAGRTDTLLRDNVGCQFFSDLLVTSLAAAMHSHQHPPQAALDAVQPRPTLNHCPQHAKNCMQGTTRPTAAGSTCDDCAPKSCYTTHLSTTDIYLCNGFGTASRDQIDSPACMSDSPNAHSIPRQDGSQVMTTC
jgi:hypothetical protein